MKELQKILSKVRQACDHYNMIDDDDTIAVGVSGGKDSLALLIALAKLREFYPKKFNVCAISVDLGFDKENDIFAPVSSLANTLNVDYRVEKTQIGDIVFNERKEKNPCSLCAKLRRGALVNCASDMGANKLALGHHLDDAVETFMLSLMYEGRIGCFSPVTVYEDRGISVIRPMIYTMEKDISSFAKKEEISVVKNPCPNDGTSQRTEMKKYLRGFSVKHDELYKKVLGALERSNIDGWYE